MSKNELKNQILETWKSRYNEQVDIWRDVERKAQIVLTVDTVFAAFLFNSVNTSASAFSLLQRVFIVITLAFLITSILSGLLVVTLRKKIETPEGRVIEAILKAKLESGVILNNEALAFVLTDITRCWKKSARSIQIQLLKKQSHLKCAYYCLGGAIFLVFLIICLVLFSSAGTSTNQLFKYINLGVI